MAHDSLGLTIGAGQAAIAWDKTVTGFLAHSAATPDHLGETLELAPDHPLGWAVKGLFTLLLGRSELKPAAADALTKAREVLDQNGGTARERAYVDALDCYLAGRLHDAVAMLEQVLDREPGDALAMKLSHAIRFVLGDRRGMLESTSRVIGYYPADHRHAGYALGCHAFALEENGDYAGAERAGRAGLELAADDAWGLHAVAHVHDMTARNADGIRWLESQQQAYARCNNFGYHVWWHLALFYLDIGDIDRVLDLYDHRIRPEHTDDYRDIANGASMLVRLEIEGVDVGDRWEELAALAAGRVEDGAVVFADLHYLMAMHGGGRDEAAEAIIARMSADAQHAEHDMHEVARIAGLPCAMGLAAFRAGDYGVAFDRLRRVRPDLQAVGGSHAQRDVFSRLMIEAGIRARRWREAEHELAYRAKRRGAEDGFTARRRASIARLAAAGLAAE